MVIVNTVVHVRADLGGTNDDVAFLFAAYGLGSMAVAVLLSRLLDRVPTRTVMLTGASAMAVLLVIASTGPGWMASLILWALARCGRVGDRHARGTAPAPLLRCRQPARRLRRAVRSLARLLARHLSSRRVAWREDRPWPDVPGHGCWSGRGSRGRADLLASERSGRGRTCPPGADAQFTACARRSPSARTRRLGGSGATPPSESPPADPPSARFGDRRPPRDLADRYRRWVTRRLPPNTGWFQEYGSGRVGLGASHEGRALTMDTSLSS